MIAQPGWSHHSDAAGIAVWREAGYIVADAPGPATMTSGTPIDPKALDLLNSLESDRPGLISEVVRLFLADAPKQMQLIDDGHAARDNDQVSQAAHFLRSGAMALGLTQLTDASLAVERADLAEYGLAPMGEKIGVLRVELRNALLALLTQVDKI